MDLQHTITNKLLAAIAAAALVAGFSPLFASAATAVTWEQGFETDTDGWFDADDAWYGEVTRVPSGTDGITSSEGDFHAIFEGDSDSGPFTRFDGYRDSWSGEWFAEVDVYLDPALMSEGEGFDYSVASNGSDGNHQRDFIFHVGAVSSTTILVNGSNNTDFVYNESKLLDNNDGNYYELTEAGWYTLQHHFYDDGGQLAVDLNLIDDSGTVVWTATRSDASDIIPDEIGGNRYGWFTYISVTDGIAVDESSLEITLGDPAAKQDCMMGDWESYGFKNQGQCVRFIETGKDSR